MSIPSRLAKIEQATAERTGRCDRCADRPETVVRNSYHEQRTSSVEACSACGWSPLVVRIVRDRNWRGGL